METKIPQSSLPQNTLAQAATAAQAPPGQRGPVDSFRPSQGETAEAQVFDPNPVVTLKDSTLKDRAPSVFKDTTVAGKASNHFLLTRRQTGERQYRQP